jgi:hypothetical protein
MEIFHRSIGRINRIGRKQTIIGFSPLD